VISNCFEDTYSGGDDAGAVDGGRRGAEGHSKAKGHKPRGSGAKGRGKAKGRKTAERLGPRGALAATDRAGVRRATIVCMTSVCRHSRPFTHIR